MRTPQQTGIRDERLDVLLGNRGKPGDRAVRLDEVNDIIRDGSAGYLREVMMNRRYIAMADVVLTTSNTWYEIARLPLVPGIWQLSAVAQHLRNDASGGRAAVRLLRGGADVLAEVQGYHAAVSGGGMAFTLIGITRTTENTVVTMEMMTETGAATALMSATAPFTGGGGPTTTLNAMRIGAVP